MKKYILIPKKFVVCNSIINNVAEKSLGISAPENASL